MRARLCRSMRGWAPLCAIVAAGCGIPAYTLGQCQIPVRHWETALTLATKDEVYAANKEGSALIAIDPVSLRWRELRSVHGLVSFDLGPDGIWTLELRDWQPPPRKNGRPGIQSRSGG